MKHLSKHILALLMIGFVSYSPSAYAISKLDFFTQLENLNQRIQKAASKCEEKYNKAMSDLEEKIEKATGSEGRAIFNKMREDMEKNSIDFYENAVDQAKSGDFDFSKSLKNVTNQYANMKLDLNTATSLLNDYKQSLDKERNRKEKAINDKLLLLKVELQSETVQKDDKRREEINKQIADLEQQKEALAAEKIQRDEKAKSLEQGMQKAADKAAKLKKQVSEEEIKGYLDKATQSLFAPTEETEEEKAIEEMYGADVKAFFLGKYEYESSENIARVRSKRQREYYNSLLNLMKVITTGVIKEKQISEASANYLNRTTGGNAAGGKEAAAPEGIFGGMAMKIGADIQNAKAAAVYMELLLAEIRFNTMTEINLWNDKYRLMDYSKDYTKFNLDDYVAKKKSLLDQAKDKAKDAATSGISGWKGL
ncbi:MAG: hypothetical protein ACI4OE_01220 [Alphaproteobacteria bacterium]|nr:hypothetical protein [Alphaproteobacteria bacterium]MDY4689092.1 hypothetical protein [Alphaproteobacteria bacterium]